MDSCSGGAAGSKWTDPASQGSGSYSSRQPSSGPRSEGMTQMDAGTVAGMGSEDTTCSCQQRPESAAAATSTTQSVRCWPPARKSSKSSVGSTEAPASIRGISTSSRASTEDGIGARPDASVICFAPKAPSISKRSSKSSNYVRMSAFSVGTEEVRALTRGSSDARTSKIASQNDQLHAHFPRVLTWMSFPDDVLPVDSARTLVEEDGESGSDEDEHEVSLGNIAAAACWPPAQMREAPPQPMDNKLGRITFSHSYSQTTPQARKEVFRLKLLQKHGFLDCRRDVKVCVSFPY